MEILWLVDNGYTLEPDLAYPTITWFYPPKTHVDAKIIIDYKNEEPQPNRARITALREEDLSKRKGTFLSSSINTSPEISVQKQKKS